MKVNIWLELDLCLGSFGYTSLSFKVFLVEIFTDRVEKKLLKRLVHTYNPYRDFKNGLKGAKSQNGSLKRASNITIFKLHKYWDSCTLETFDICNLEFKRWKVVMNNMFWLGNNDRGFLETRIYLLVSRRINPNFWWTLLNFVWTLVYFLNGLKFTNFRLLGPTLYICGNNLVENAPHSILKSENAIFSSKMFCFTYLM